MTWSRTVQPGAGVSRCQPVSASDDEHPVQLGGLGGEIGGEAPCRPARQRPCQTGRRLSRNAAGPSCASSLRYTGSQIALGLVERLAPAAARRTSRTVAFAARTDSGAFAAIRSPSSCAAARSSAGRHHLVDQPDLVGALGVDRLAGEQQLHGDPRRHEPAAAAPPRARPGRPWPR